MGAAVKPLIALDSVPDHAAAATRASGCKLGDRTLEAIEGKHLAAAEQNTKTLVVVISTSVAANSHWLRCA
jgi:hypothetical protein